VSRYTSRAITIGTAATAIGTAAPGTVHELTLGNFSAKKVYIGDSNVLTDTGFHLENTDNPLTLKITDGDILFAIVDSGTTTLHVYDFAVDV
jgi:hypothetical protein